MRKVRTLIAILIIVVAMLLSSGCLFPEAAKDLLSQGVENANQARDQALARLFFNAVSLAQISEPGTLTSANGVGLDELAAASKFVAEQAGLIESDDRWGWVIQDGVCVSATVNDQTYSQEPSN